MKCSLCNAEIKFGGILFAKKDGSTSYFCSSKCFKNAKLGRRMVKWREQ